MSNLKDIRGFVSTNNSSTATLGVSGVFTGTGEDISQYSTITVFYDTDVDGSISMQFSSDNSNWDRSKVVTIDQTLASGNVHTLEVVSQYFRIVYTNGTSGQGHFRLQTIYHTARSGFLTSSPDQIISKITDAQVMRVANDPFIDFSRSLYSDKIAIHKFGANQTSPSGSERDIWGYGDTGIGNIDYNWQQSASTVRIAAGGDANDTSAGNGARVVTVEGLDTNWDIAIEDITTAGASASSYTSTSFIRVNRAYVKDVGTYHAANTGAITIENGSAQVLAYIAAGVGQTQLSMYSVPANYTAYLRHAHGSVSAGTNKDATLRMYRVPNADDVTAPMSGAGKRLVHIWEQLQGIAELDFYSMPAFSEKTDLWWTAEGTSATSVSVVYDLILVKDDMPTNPQ